jgi:DNA-directed RNA polymerase subunit RPC12/RpoP
MDSTDSSDICFLCDQCGQDMVIVAEAAGMTIHCPNCGSAVTVPFPGTSANEIPAEPERERDIFELPLSPTAVKILERSLVAVVGPIGSPLARNAVTQAATSEELREMLIACIPSANDQAAFMEVCRRESENADSQEQEASASVRQPEKPSPAWDPAMMDAATRILANFLGPIASIMVQRAAAKAKTGSELYHRLAASIPDAKDREKFLQSAPA